MRTIPLFATLKEDTQCVPYLAILIRAQNDEVFRESLLEEGVELFLSGDVGTGRAVLRDYINATIGYEELAVLTDISSKSLMRMFGPIGNPRASNLFKIITHLRSREDVHLKVHADKRAILDNQSEDIG